MQDLFHMCSLKGHFQYIVICVGMGKVADYTLNLTELHTDKYFQPKI
jgi:hypothetical protein